MADKKECGAQKIFSDAEAETDITNWRQRNDDIALFVTDRELESHRFELYHTNQWTDQAQREKTNVCVGNYKKENGFHQESHTRSCEEIKELQRICCEKNRLSQTIEN